MKTQADFYDATQSYNSADAKTPEYSPDSIYQDNPVDRLELKEDAFVKVSDAIDSINSLSWSHQLKTIAIEAIVSITDGESVISSSRAASSLRYVLALVIESGDAKLEAKCMAYSVGLTFKGNTETEIAKEHGVSKQAVSKRVREFQETHGISSSLGNKRAGCRDVYRQGNSRRTAI